MAIDVRADVNCSLGTLISASVSDSYIQESGLVFVTGDAVINGIITPSPGTIVTFSYTKDGITRTLPRKLRVLSSFADPFRRTTSVELGCKLTYLKDLKPAPTVDGEPEVETGKRQQCLNGYIDYPADSSYGIPIMASGLMTTCLTRLGITATSNPLTNAFFRDSFEFDAGYVDVLSDLLVSESYCGYLNYSEQLEVFSLDQEGGTGPVVTANEIIDISGIGLGPPPGDAIVVRYESLNLKSDLEDETDPAVLAKRDWTEDELVGDVETAIVRFTAANGIVYQNIYTYTPHSKTITEYGVDNSWGDDVCVLYSSVAEGADLSNSVIKRTTIKNVLKAQQANDYCSQLLAAGFAPGGATEGNTTIIETFEYDNDGQVVRQTTDTYEPFFAWAGRGQVQYVYNNPNPEAVVLGSGPVLVSRVIVDTETLYANLPTLITLDPGETYKRATNGQKIVTTTYLNWLTSQQGNTAIAAINQNAPFTSALFCSDFLNDVASKLILDETTIQISRDRLLVGIERRPAAELRIGGDSSSRGESTSELLYTSGSPTGQRIVELTMPLQSDDYYTRNGGIIKGDAPAKAARYGRAQNRLLLGNRNGINIQLQSELLPAAPFSPIIVQANGLSALYRTNGSTWTMDSNGILASTDALFWGAVGGTGVFWFPVAPGITTLPAEPAIVDGQMTVGTVVPVWNETVIVTATTRLGIVATSLKYALELLIEVPALSIKLGLAARSIRKVLPPAGGITVAAQVPSISISASVKPPIAAIALAAEAPAVASSASVAVPSFDITVSALVPQRVGGIILVPSIDLTLASAVPVVSTGASVAVPSKDLAFTASVPTLLDAVDYYGDWVAQTYGFEADIYPSWWAS